MNEHVTFNQVTERLSENSLDFKILKLSGNSKIIISTFGGRIFGPFFSDEHESIFWTNKAFSNKSDFEVFLDTSQWNLGGERLWIAPEIQFRIKDRNDFWNTYILPESMDPANYVVKNIGENKIELSANIDLSAYNLNTGIKELKIERTIMAINNPLENIADYQSLMKGVLFSGYEHDITIAERKNDGILAEAWTLIQLNPGGHIYIPVTKNTPGIYTDYFSPVDQNFLENGGNFIKLKITGNRQYKIGLNAAFVIGRAAYLNDIDINNSYIIIRNFFNNPSSYYCEEPPDLPGYHGNSLHIYNDDGGFGGFGELECNGQTIGGITGKSSSYDPMTLWVFMGDKKRIKKIAGILLGIEI